MNRFNELWGAFTRHGYVGSRSAAWSISVSKHLRLIKILIVCIMLMQMLQSFVGSGWAAAGEWERSNAVDRTVAPKRAIVIVSGRADADGAGQSSLSARKYASLLGDLGFDTLTIPPRPRPDLDQAIRQAATSVPPSAQIAVFVTGRVLTGSNDLFIIPADASSVDSASQTAIDAETIRLTFVFRRLAAAAPKEIVAVIDDCTPLTRLPSIGSTIAGVPISLVCLNSKTLRNETELVDRVTGVMKIEGLNFEQFKTELSNVMRNGAAEVASSADLSRTFYFIEHSHFDRIENPCNKIVVDASAAQARAANLAIPIEACGNAVRRWPYVPSFRARQDAGREQQSFQKSMTSCRGIRADESYIDTYPNGRYIREAADYRRSCQPPDPPPVPPRPHPAPRPQPRPPQPHLPRPQPPRPDAHPHKCRTFVFNNQVRCE